MALNFRNFGQRLLDSTTLDEKIGGAFKTAAKTGRQWGQELKQGFIPAVKQTAPTVAQDFGNMFRNTFKNVPVLKTAGNIVGDFGQRAGSSIVDVTQGAYRTAQRPDLLGKAQGVAQTVRGIGKGMVSALPVTPFVDIAANTGKSDSLSRRLATGYSRGISQIPELAPNTQAKNVNIGKLSFDPAMMGAEMVGFVKNPINKKLFEATNKLIPSAEKSLKLWLATTASRGGLENILLAMPEMPEKMSTIQKAQWMATNAGIGAAQEIAGQGIIKGLGKVGGAIADSKAGKVTAEQLAKQFDNLNEFKRKASIPVSKPGFGPKLGQTITEPMWKWEMGLVDDGSMKQYNSDIDTPKLSVEPTKSNPIQDLAIRKNSPQELAYDLSRKLNNFEMGDIKLSKDQKIELQQWDNKNSNTIMARGITAVKDTPKWIEDAWKASQQPSKPLSVEPSNKLISEAKKYNNAEDFVKAEWDKVQKTGKLSNGQKVDEFAASQNPQYYPNTKTPRPSGGWFDDLTALYNKNKAQPSSVEGGGLLAEARKYKSADEFVKSKVNAYHGTDKEFTEFDLSKAGSTQGKDKYGMFFTDQPDVAKSYSSLYPQKSKYKWTPEDKIQAEKAIVMEAHVNDSNALTLQEVADLYKQGKIKTKPNLEGNVRPSSYFDLNREAIKEAMDVTGKDVFTIKAEGQKFYAVNNQNKMLSKSQLTDLWNKAQSPSPQLGGKVGTIKGVTSSTKAQTPLQPPELQKINMLPEAPKASLSSDTIITPAGNLPKRSGMLKQQLMEAQQNLEQSQVVAEQNKLIRDNFSPDQIKDINQLKMLAKKSLDQGGDIETLRGKYPKLVESVTSHVREADQTITGDSEALDFALSLPTKAETKVNMTEVRQIQKQLDPIAKLDEAGVQATTGDKSVTSAIVEPSAKTIKGITNKQTKLDAANEVRARKKLDEEWQKAVFGEAQTRTVKQAEKELAKAIKISTNDATFLMNKADSWKDKNTMSLGRETMDRNFEDIMGKDAPEMKRKLLEPVYKAEADRNRFLNKERADIKALGIKQGSKESALVQDYGEGNITREQLATQTKDVDKIVKASEVIRSKYDGYIDQLNRVLTRNGYEPIPKRKDYFHHFEELGGIFDTVGVSLKASDLPTDINGLTADFKPGKTFFSAALKRTGEKTAIDAIGGIDKYLEGASNQIYHTDNIQALRSFEDTIRQKYAGTTHLSNFAANLTEYTNTLAGKKSMLDRGAEAMVGRKIYEVANGLKQQVGANMVGANISSAITNFIPLTQTLATTNKASVLHAIMQIIANVGKDDGFIKNSDFLTTRLGSDNLKSNLWKNTAETFGWLFKTVDSFTSQVVTRSKYLEALKKGASEDQAMNVANTWARKLMAGRGKGEMPTWFNSKIAGALTQFQLEVNNQLSFMMKDIPRNFDKAGAASAIAQLFLYGYLFNNLYEKTTGRRPAFDPIGVGQRTYEDYTNPDMKKGQATKNLIGNVSNQLPFVSTFTGGRLPITSAIPSPMDVVSGKSTLKKELTKPLQFMLPTGGGQIKKSIEGIKAYNQGASTSPSGGVRFVIPQNTANRVRTTLFGQWSTPEAQKYLREGQNILGEKQTKQVMGATDKVAEYTKVKAKSLFDKKIDAEKEKMKADNKSVSGDIETIDISKEIAVPKYTGQKEVDKKLVSAYKGKITSRINDIVKLVEAGKIEPVKAEEMIKTLKATQLKLSGGKKAKKITIKYTKAPKVSFKLAKPTKMSVIKAPTTRKARLSFKNYKPAKIKV